MKIDFPVPSQYEALSALWQDAFGDSEEFVDGFFYTGFSPARCRCAVEEGKLVAALYWFDVQYENRRFAYIYAVAVDKAYRGRGIARKLMEDTHAHLKLRGYEGVLLLPQQEGLRQMYAKMGYTDCTKVREFCCLASDTAVEIQRIDREEFSRRRYTYLPENGAIQEDENIAYLEMMAFFYTGPDFLLAARKQGQRLFGLELLGNAHAAPGILKALDCTEGCFRTPGEEMEFTMFYPLQENVTPPTYVGLVFD